MALAAAPSCRVRRYSPWYAKTGRRPADMEPRAHRPYGNSGASPKADSDSRYSPKNVNATAVTLAPEYKHPRAMSSEIGYVVSAQFDIVAYLRI